MTQTNQPNPENTAPEAPPIFYQAVGRLEGVIQKNPEGFLEIVIDGAAYRLYGDPKFLARVERRLGEQTTLLCWPQCIPVTGLSFKAFSFGADFPAPVGFFKISGIYQKIPQCKTPVVSVYRNHLAAHEDRLYARAQHLPVTALPYRRPYRFSPDNPKPTGAFIQVVARFDPGAGNFEFLTELAPPCDPPRRIHRKKAKPPKPAKGKGKRPAKATGAGKPKPKPVKALATA